MRMMSSHSLTHVFNIMTRGHTNLSFEHLSLLSELSDICVVLLSDLVSFIANLLEGFFILEMRAYSSDSLINISSTCR